METRAANGSGWSRVRLGLIERVIDGQRGHLFAWTPVCLGIGIGLYFGSPREPGWTDLSVIWSLIAALWLLRWRAGPGLGPIAVGVTLVALGFCAALTRAHTVAAPVLDFRFYGAIEGRIVKIDRSQSNKPRLTLDRVVLDGIARIDTPAYVRVSLHGEQPFLTPHPGQVVMITGHLSPPAGPVEPGGFDFQRKAWFDRLGALGYTRVPALLLEPPTKGGAWLWIADLRAKMTEAIKTRMGGREGPFAAAIITGDRSDLDEDALTALRASNLAHLLAISGLHMGLLTGGVYTAVRIALAAVPRLSMQIHPKRVPAIIALVAAVFYLAISGASIATQRAFIMALVMLLAICFERKAISLRSVAIAAILILLWSPEALIGPGFQMSFAATTALVAVFAILRNYRGERRVPKWLRGFTSLLMASFIAGVATAPYGAAHFNQMAHYGLLANLASVPVMGSIVMPGAVLAAVLSIVGLDWIGLAIMKAGLAWIIFVAETVSSWEGAVSKISAPDPLVLPLITLGALFIGLWQSRARIAGVFVILIAGVIWAQSPRPEILVSETGLIFGVLTPLGRMINKPKGDGFTARSWLENDGDNVDQETAAARGAFEPKFAILGDGSIVFDASNKLTEQDIRTYCARYAIVIVAAYRGPPQCGEFGQARLRRSGSFSIDFSEGAPVLRTSRDAQGERFWLID